MKVKNNSGKVIGIQDTSILPGETGEIPKGYEKNPIVLKYIENGTFTEIQARKAAASSGKSVDDGQDPDGKKAETGGGQDPDGKKTGSTKNNE